MKPPKKYIINNNVVFEIFEANDEYLIYDPHFIKKENSIIYENKNDAMYAKLIQELSKGKDITNFKSSPYYTMYIERLKKQNPEYAI